MERTEELVERFANVFNELAKVDDTNPTSSLTPRTMKSIADMLIHELSNFEYSIYAVNGEMPELVGEPGCMRRWAIERSLVAANHAEGFFFDRPSSYGKKYYAVQLIEFNAMYPTIIAQFKFNEYLNSDGDFWSAYGICMHYRSQMKLTMLTTEGYMLFKRFANSVYGLKVEPNAMPVLAIVTDYARHVMAELILELGHEKVLYASVDELFADVSEHEARTAVERINANLPYDVKYISEIEFESRRKYRVKLFGGEIIEYGYRQSNPAKVKRPTHATTPINNTI